MKVILSYVSLSCVNVNNSLEKGTKLSHYCYRPLRASLVYDLPNSADWLTFKLISSIACRHDIY